MYQGVNRTAVVDYFKAGEKGSSLRGSVGVELEHFIVEKDSLAPVPYEPHGNRLGVRDVLEHLAAFYPEKTFTPEGDLIGLASEDGSITIEPAAQLEISLATFQDVADVRAAYERFRSRLDPYLDERGALAVSAGYHPSARALDLELIPKERYRFMNDYFAHIGTHGERMMRASASLQVSIDYADERDAVRKMRVASALAPLLAAIADNVVVFEGEPVPYSLARLRLWRDVDDARCKVVPGVFEPGFGFEAYADWLLRTSPIFVDRPAASDPDGPRERAAGETPASEVYGDAPMTQHDVEHLMSMFWPDVRLKRFVEIRPADCLPAELAFGYVALVKGIFYSETALAQVEAELGVVDDVWPLRESNVEAAIDAIADAGLDAEAYGKTLRAWEELLFAAAARALSPEEAAYLEPLKTFALAKYEQAGR